VVGAYMLYSRVTTANSVPPANGQPYAADPRAGAPTPNDFMGTRHE